MRQGLKLVKIKNALCRNRVRSAGMIEVLVGFSVNWSGGFEQLRRRGWFAKQMLASGTNAFKRFLNVAINRGNWSERLNKSEGSFV